MSDASTLPPLKTWSHLAGQRRRPSEYEIVSTNLPWHTRVEGEPWEVAPQGFMSDWYRRYRDASPVQHENWNAFRDPDELVYRTYNILQDGQETYVDGLLEQYSAEDHDASLSPASVDVVGQSAPKTRTRFVELDLDAALEARKAYRRRADQLQEALA